MAAALARPDRSWLTRTVGRASHLAPRSARRAAACGLVALSGLAPLASQTFQVGSPVRVSAGRSHRPHVEPSLAADPADPALLFGAAVTWDEGAADLRDSVVLGFRSADGGASWSAVALPGCRTDPWVRFGDPGHVFVACLGGEGGSEIRVLRSRDGGRTWEGAVLPGGGGGAADRPVLVVESRSTGRPERVSVAYGQWAPAGDGERSFTVALATSEDGGRTFPPPSFLRHDRLEQQPFDAVARPGAGPVVAFMDFAGPTGLLAHRRTWTVRTADGGRSFSLPRLAWEQLGSEMPWSLAVDRSGPRPGRLILAVDGAWSRSGVAPPAGPGGALFLLRSDDGGASWSRPSPVPGIPPGANAELPVAAVAPGGDLALAWVDTRHDPAGRCFDLFVTVSPDGGETFLPPARVTPETSCPQAITGQRGVAARWPFGGDYLGLAAGGDGRFHLLWVDSRSGLDQVWTSAVTVAP